MTSLDIARQILQNQHLSSTEFKKPADVVKWLGAVQAQDYYGAKWALGQRMVGATDDGSALSHRLARLKDEPSKRPRTAMVHSWV